jgi:hypothetical protein
MNYFTTPLPGHRHNAALSEQRGSNSAIYIRNRLHTTLYLTITRVILDVNHVSLVVLIHILALVVVSVTTAPTVVLTIIFLQIFIPDIIIAIISILVPCSWHPLFRMVYYMLEL